jgi:hypothetical protein
MPLLRRRPLKSAAMVGGTGYQFGEDREITAAAGAPVEDAASETNRIDALTKLKDLFVAGVLTREQYDSELARLTADI